MDTLFFRDTFNTINPEISLRLKQHIQQRIILPYLDRNDMWWQGFELKGNQLVNNWNPWCNFNVLTCLLLVEDNPDVQLAGIYKTMTSVDRFIDYIKKDGACEEGPSYWGTPLVNCTITLRYLPLQHRTRSVSLTNLLSAIWVNISHNLILVVTDGWSILRMPQPKVVETRFSSIVMGKMYTVPK
ncbi:hypothetical protein KUH03_13485 [Sphingobacterium sp. E70]|uniref:hypothetical protein n=1 Tax=Sphingobacterium sp. E70 TaxID=2853439 RepID=UPI00211C966E|nr:hypothetical protein [Sphingobacterium sp. E70]ULT27621.1 hypothetical protein KUH03_13485 [Sphingobacterium sp. E70]